MGKKRKTHDDQEKEKEKEKEKERERAKEDGGEGEGGREGEGEGELSVAPEREVVDVNVVVVECVSDLVIVIQNLRYNYHRIQKERNITPFVAFDCEVFYRTFSLLSFSLSFS